ncbi:hypothetical protein HU200_065419 [Digitaria exilis]|uniref:Uncharacterized protein n=1 Tax=Digitaria exilis TaxID=1010633 RepID=A0A835DXH5_9POAL|nr:hypothetical protein HU200_065419 [Digitaria exilis]
MDYMRMMSSHACRFQKQAQAQLHNKAAAPAQLQQEMRMEHPIQLTNTVQAIQRGNDSSFASIPQTVPMMASPARSPFQSQNQHMASPFVPNMQVNVNQRPSDMMEMLYPASNFNPQPATVAPVERSVQFGYQVMQPIAMHSRSQHPAMQLHPTNTAQFHQPNMAQLQGNPIAWPNDGYHNHLARQNVYAYEQHLQPTVQQHFGITQQHVGMQNCQMRGANVANMNDGHSGGWNNHQNAGLSSGIQSPLKECEQVAPKKHTKMESELMPPAQRQITVNQQSNADESIGQMRQNVVTTQSAGQKTRSNQLQGVTSPRFSMKSPGVSQSSPVNEVGRLGKLSPIDMLEVVSPNALLTSRSQSPVAKLGIVADPSPTVSLNSTLTSTVEKSGFLAAASPCASVKSASPSDNKKSGIIPAISPSDRDSSFLLHNNAEGNGCNQITPTKLLRPDPPCQTQTPAVQAEDQKRSGAQAPVAKKPIDRLIAAVSLAYFLISITIALCCQLLY